MIREENLPYGMTSSNNMHNRISLGMLEASYRADDRQLATKIADAFKMICYNRGVTISLLDADQQADLQYENSTNEELINLLNQINQNYAVRQNQRYSR